MHTQLVEAWLDGDRRVDVRAYQQWADCIHAWGLGGAASRRPWTG